MQKVVVTFFFLLAVVATGGARAACPVTNTLVNGTTADATPVMQNFNDLAACAAPLNSPQFTGTVGIGTTSPSSQFSVVGGTPGAGSAYLTGGLGLTFLPQQISVMSAVPSSSSIFYANALFESQSNAASSTTGSIYGIVNDVFDSPSTSTNQPSMTATLGSVTHKGTGLVGTLFGTDSRAVNASATAVASVVAIKGLAENSAAGASATTVVGVSGLAGNFSPSSIDSARALYGLINNHDHGATITVAASVYADLFNVGTIGTTYGVYVATMTGGTQTNHPYSFYASDTSAWNYFGGSVGIGTTSPAVSLAVVGDVRVGTSGSNGCIQNFAGTALTGTCSSDAALKTVTGNVTQVLDKLASLQLITFHWNKTAAALYHASTTALNTGFIAQSVEQAFPELVSLDAHGYRQLDYTTLSLYGLEAIKELKATNDRQAAEITSLKSRMADQDSAIRDLRAEMAALRRIRTAAR